MLFITGDNHGSFYRYTKDNFWEQKEMTKKDTVIVCGDFGGVWYRRDNREKFKKENKKLDELDSRSFTTVFVPGNHENYQRLMSDEFPVKEWNGGLVKEIRPSILMLMRGEMYDIEGKKIFAFGGASSHDIEDGILDYNDPNWKRKARQLRSNGKNNYRVRNLSWWPEELPSEEEKQHALDTLVKHNWKCDFVITHEGPASDVILLSNGVFRPDDFSKWLEKIRGKLDYKHWFFGHYHEEKNINMKEHVVYHQIERIV